MNWVICRFTVFYRINVFFFFSENGLNFIEYRITDTPAAPPWGGGGGGGAMLMRGRSLNGNGQSSRYLAMMTRQVLTKLFKAWFMIEVLTPVYHILILSQSRHSAAPNWHALNYWLAYTMTETYLLMVLYQWGQSPCNLGEIKLIKFRKFHLNPSNDDVKNWFEKLRFPHLDPRCRTTQYKSQYILHGKWPLVCIICTHANLNEMD